MSAYDGSSSLVEEDFPAIAANPRPRTADRAELETQVGDLQKRITDLTRELSTAERERATVEESRRRFSEFETGREELLNEMTRSLGLLNEAEQNSRRDAEQMARTIGDLREALGKVASLADIDTHRDEWKLELTRNLTTLENARMELNSARIKWPLLSAQSLPASVLTDGAHNAHPTNPLLPQTFGQLCLIGLAVSWPLLLLGMAVFLYIITR
ncbi:MAG: hypothetical protein EXS22_00980 [Pedosphaera sp.]|nr:hypothetical protein [Pedosphaera sp.]MSU42598.1 hypothetical protein [Pedosphaera sp.]